MWFLILEILFLLLLAFFLGWLVAYWWFMRRYEDVSESYEEILADLRRDARAQAKAQDHVMGELSKLTGSGVGAGVKPFDLSPVEERLSRMERALGSIRLPEPDLGPVQARMAGIEQRLGNIRLPDVDLRPVHERLARLEQGIMNSRSETVDMRPVFERLGGLERAVTGFRVPVTDLTPVQDRLVQLENSLRSLSLPEPDLSPLERRLQDIEAYVTSTDLSTDLSPVTQRLDRVENYLSRLQVPEIDLGPVHSGIVSLQQAIAGIELPHTDLAPLHRQIAELQQSVASFRVPETDLAPVAQRIEGVESALASLKIPETNLTPIYQRLQAIESAILGFSIPDTDLDPLHRQLQAIEAKLDLPGDGAGPLTAQMSRLEDNLSAISMSISSLRPPGNELLEARLSGIENALRNFSVPQPTVDLYPVQERIQSLETSLANYQPQQTDFTPMTQRLADLESAVTTVYHAVSALRTPNMQPVEERLRRLEDMVANIHVPDVDLGPLQGTLMRLDQSLQAVRSDVRGMPGLESVEKRLSSLQDALMSIREPDLTPVLRTMRSIDTRLDLGAFEDRLNAIEYGLAAVHRTLRSRTDVSLSRSETEIEYSPSRSARRERADTNGSLGGYSRPPRERDPINRARRAGDKANLLTGPEFGEADDLERINGVGPMLSELLNDIGVFYFWQIAEWTPEEVDWVDDQLLHFKGRIERDNWVSQARTLTSERGVASRPSR
jgi:predicted flap endonuclease-1-like 5' DNA nuclease